MFSSNLNRRQFFSFNRNNKTHIIRPPWALEEEAFQDGCTRCGDCIGVCPENILIREGVNGFPRVDFKRGECTFCADCVLACPTAALSRPRSSAWTLKAHVGEACMAKQQVICTSCSEQCEVSAIHFAPLAGVIAQPQINIDVCTGCGACVAPCPTQAIEVK